MPLRYDPLTPLDRTPPFVRWTLARECSLRQFTVIHDPEGTERLLRGVRCTSDALHEARVRQGIAFAAAKDGLPRFGFSVEAVLQPFGGMEIVSKECNNCPANAIAAIEPGALAGCVGLVVPPADEEFHGVFNQHVDRFTASFDTISTSPRWYSLWIGPLTIERLRWQRDLLNSILQEREDVLGLRDYLAAIDIAIAHEIELGVQMYPGGRCEGRQWFVNAHCLRCKATWPETKRQQCRVCGQVGGRQAERERKRIGTRPYRELSEFLGDSALQELLD